MPYILPEKRNNLNPLVADLGGRIEDVGQLNYVITRLIMAQLDKQIISYVVLNGLVGVLDSVKTEFNRRVVAPYEDQAKERNGDIF